MSNPMKVTRRKAIKVDAAAAGKKIFGTKHSMSVSEEEFGSLFEKFSGGLHVSQLNAVMLEARNTMFEAFKVGGTVHIPYWGTFRVVARGKEDPNVNDGNAEITLEAKLLVAAPIKKALAVQGAVPYDVVEQAQVIPTITSVKDLATDAQDQTLTLGGLLDIRGTNLKFDKTKSNEGIYLIPTDPAGTAVKFSKLYPPQTTHLQPEVPTGLEVGATYQIEIRTCPYGTENLRIGRYSPIFTIA